jgi:hypothetical protein
LALGDFSAQIKLSYMPFCAEKSPDANFCRKGAETEDGGVLKTSRHLWTHGVFFFSPHLLMYLYVTIKGKTSWAEQSHTRDFL